MKKLLLAMFVWIASTTPSYATLDVGDAAPNFTAQAALGGKVFDYALAPNLAKGPVVLFFFPAAFSVGCSLEAKEFADAMGRFEALGATVIGVSTDDIDTLGKFSVQACQGKFPVASDNTQKVVKLYEAAMTTKPDFANRVSYVIAPNGKVVFAYQNLNPGRHVERTLAALQELRKAKP
jgi:peroxiredoxin